MRDPKTSLDINKTRQIAQEIIKVKGRPPALSACVRVVVAALSLPLAGRLKGRAPFPSLCSHLVRLEPQIGH